MFGTATIMVGIGPHSSFTLFLGSRRAHTCGPILTIYTSYDMFTCKEVPFGVAMTQLPIRGSNPKKTRMWAMPNVTVALPNIGGAFCSTPQSLAHAHY